MSLINQVLQDLDQRQAGLAETPAAARGLRSVHPALANSGRWAAVLGAALVGAAIAGVGSLAWSNAQSRAVGAAGTLNAPMEAAVMVRSNAPIDAPMAPTPIASAGNEPATAPVTDPTLGPKPALADAPGNPAVAAPEPAPVSVPSLPPPSERLALAVVRAPLATNPAPGTGSPAAVAPVAPGPTALPKPSVATPTEIEARIEKRPQPSSARERAEAAYQQGVSLHQQGRATDAQAAFTSALQDDRGHAAARQALAISLAARGGMAEAQAVLADGLELQPRHLPLAMTLARLKSSQHDLPGAIEVLKSALGNAAGLAPSEAEQAQALALLATLQQSASQHAPAIENYAAALRLAPGNGVWWIGLGLSLGADGRPQSAREAFTRARSTESLSPELQQFVEQRLR